MIDTIRIRMYGILETTKGTTGAKKAIDNKDIFIISGHNDLYKAMIKYKKSNFSMIIVKNEQTQAVSTLTEDEFLQIKNNKNLSEHYQIRNRMHFIQEGEVKEINMKIKGKYRVPSSFSDVVFNINENGSYIDFEFSIPKYLYGHNLAEFVPQVGSSLHKREGIRLTTFKGQKKYVFKRLEKFIDKFFFDLCSFFKVETMPDNNYIEIRRVDLCYNQYFKTKGDALLYLEEQKKINLIRQRENSKIAQNYETSISYVGTGGSYFKIYHKGSEYSKSGGDLKKHLELNQNYIDHLMRDFDAKTNRHKKNYEENKKLIWYLFDSKGKGEPFVVGEEMKDRIKGTVNKIAESVPFKIDFLKEEMDKVLRYEVSLTSQFFMSAYKRRVFRNYGVSTTQGVKKNEIRVPYHTRHFRKYLDTKNALDNRTRDDEKLSAYDRQNYKMIHEWLNRKISLVLGEENLRLNLTKHEKSDNGDFDINTGKYKISRFEYRHTILANKDVGLFSNRFLDQCFNHFDELIQHYQIKKLKPFDDLIAKLNEYNRQAEINLNRYNLFHQLDLRDRFGEIKIKNGKPVKKASQLLTQSQLREKKLKKVNVTLLSTFLLRMENKGLDKIFKELKTPASTKHRIKKDLELIGVFSQTLRTDINIDVRTDFHQMYNNTRGILYREKFFIDQKLFNKAHGKSYKKKKKII